MAAILNKKNVAEKGEHVIDEQARERGASQAAPD
jgi:hypothetical protein